REIFATYFTTTASTCIADGAACTVDGDGNNVGTRCCDRGSCVIRDVPRIDCAAGDTGCTCVGA
ncbi:unnamed protein product, partial [Adineta steineri]